MLELRFLTESTSSSSVGLPLFSVLVVRQPCSGAALDKLSTLDDSLSISLNISRWLSSVSFRRLEVLFSQSY